jgi:hypothetical protein
MPKLQAVLLSGGSGTRLWPLSREAYPKQFLPLVGDDTMLQATWRASRTLAMPLPSWSRAKTIVSWSPSNCARSARRHRGSCWSRSAATPRRPSPRRP